VEVVPIVVRTKIAQFGPGQFKNVLAKTEIAVFGPGQNPPARLFYSGGKNGIDEQDQGAD
jgi:hypothetical protein